MFALNPGAHHSHLLVMSLRNCPQLAQFVAQRANLGLSLVRPTALLHQVVEKALVVRPAIK